MAILHDLRRRIGLLVAIVVVLGLAQAAPGHALEASVEQALRDSAYVYLTSQRKDGTFGEPAEIWFMFEQGAVWVGTRKTSWRARRIGAGRTAATIAVGKRDGPVLKATGRFVEDEKMYETMFRVFAEKYPQGWKKYEEGFRTGFADGSRVLIRYDIAK